MAHNLFLGMYTFTVKKARTKNDQVISNNDFLSKSYPNVSGSKFGEGFVKDFISLIDSKTFKNNKNTHGGILDDSSFNSMNRTLDIMIDGGLTGIKQYIIDDSGKKSNVPKKSIVGLKFYARVWLPNRSNTGYVFIQKYGSLSIKPLFDEIIGQIYRDHGFTIIDKKLKKSATKARQKMFLKKARLRDITVVSERSKNQTGAADSSAASIKIRNIKIDKKTREIDTDDINSILKGHGFRIRGKDYIIKATYENKTEDFQEEKTIVLDDSEETINVVPSVLIPNSCIDTDNYPIFEKMREFTDAERAQVMIESKLN